MNLILQWALKIVLAWAYSLTRADLDKASSWVREAEVRFSESPDKKAFVHSQISQAMPGLKSRAINFLIELGLARLEAARK